MIRGTVLPVPSVQLHRRGLNEVRAWAWAGTRRGAGGPAGRRRWRPCTAAGRARVAWPPPVGLGSFLPKTPGVRSENAVGFNFCLSVDDNVPVFKSRPEVPRSVVKIEEFFI